MATNVFDQFDQQASNPFDQFDVALAQKPEKTGMLRAAADIPVQVGRGVAVGVKALSDVFGADNPVSRAASGVEDYLGGLLSAQAKNDQAEIARIMKEAQDKGVGDQVTAAVKAFATAPVDMLSQALGTAVPVIAGGLAGSIARLGAAGVTAVGAGIGAGMGAGTIKGQIYDAVKQELLANKVPEAEAEKRAQEAQAYGGKNLDQILMGAGIGAAEAAFGAERILTGLLRKGAVKPSALPAVTRIPAAAATEAVPEMAQAAQEQIAQNIALQREGYEVPTMRGVAGQAALEGLAGAGLGAITGAVERTEAAKPEVKPTKPEMPPTPEEPGIVKAEAPKPETGEVGITKPEEETAVSREVTKAAEPEVAPPAPAEIAPSAEVADIAPTPSQPAPTLAEEPVAPPAAPQEKPSGAAGMGQRMVNAANRFRDSAVEQFGLTPEQADRAMGRLMKEKVLSLDPVTGQYKLKDGRFWDREVLLRAAGETASQTAPAQSAPIETKRGAATRIIAGEEKIPAQWEVVEADSVKAAMTEGKTQPRDRKRAVSNAQIMSIAQNPDFDRLSDTSQTMDYGAPTLTQDGAIVGGNGRFEGVNLSYDTDAGQRYKQSLVENAERLGLDPEQVGAMQKPILVRRITQPADTRKLAIQSNIVAGLELSDMEQAALDAERMAGLDQLDISEAGDIPITSRNMDVLRSAFKDYTTEEMGKMMSAEGGLSQAGLRRVRNAILYKAYGKTDTLARLVESPDPDLKNVGTALMRASGGMSQMMDAIRSGAVPAEYDIIEDLTGAIETLSSLRASGTKVQEFLAQTDMFGDGISGPARAILRFMDNNLRSAKSVTEFLNDYAQAVLSAESATGGLFGEAQLPTKQETVERAAQKYEAQRAAAKAQRTLEEQPAGEVRPEGRVQPEGEGRAAVSDEEARKINEQQAKDAGTPSNVTEAIEEHAFGKQMGAEPFTETRVKGHKAYITTGIRQAPNKELGKAIKDENTSGAIEQLLKSKNPIIAQIAKLASDRPLFGVGMMSYFPTLNIPKDATGVYDHVGRNILFKSKKWAESEHVVAHEMVHYLLWNAVESPTDAQKPAIQRLQKLFDHVKNTLGKEGQGLYALTNLQEFIAEANSNVNFQYKLRQIKYQNQTAWGAFTKFVSQILGLGNDTALSEIIALTEELASPESRTTGAAPAAMLAYEPEKQYRGQVGKETPPTPTTAGQQALDTINQLGMGVKAPEPGMLKKAGDALKRLGENPSGSKEEIKETIRKLFANLESKSFSSDARWESDIKKGMREDIKPVEDILGVSLLMSQSQAVGADAVSTRAMLIGGSKYDESIKKWLAYENKNANETLKARVLDQIAEKYGLTKEEASSVAHAYLVAANYEGIIARNAALEERIKQLKKDGKKDEADDLDAAIVFVSPEQAAMVEPGKAIANSIPEVKQITEIWNEQRRMVKDSMVFSGLWTEEYADALMDNAAYVPFYREPQVEADEGPKAMIRGLQVKAKEHKLKGSKEAVNDVFENMAMWQQYALNRAIRNHKALQSIDIGTTIKVGDRMMAEKVSEPKRGMNIVRVWRDGKQEFYSMADPYYVEAFQSLGSVYIEPIKYFSAISDLLRRSVVMYPLFSLGQIPQDAVAAIFASGLKPRYAFKIPFLAVREFVKTMRNTSKVHDELKNIGVVGIRDFNATIARQNAEITAGIKAPPGVMGKVKSVLEHVAMAADNAVRQSVYQASMDAGLSKAEAVEKAFEIINFRRRGSSKLLNLMGQTVPFFYAYLSAQRVAYRTLTGVGISPSERKAALETLAMTSAAVMALSFLYAMANGEDEAYEKTPGTVRDRSLVIPGTNGVRIPLRPDFFLFPKVIAEHTYHLLVDNGLSDPGKFKKGMADIFSNAVLSPNVVPQVIKPTLEASINYSFFEGKPIVGFFEKNKEAGRQFSESTSEFAKLLGNYGASPQVVDHLVRGYFGSVGGLFLWGTNFMIDGMPGVPRQDITWQDAIKTLPGVGAFKQKPTENALKVDFYELRDEVEKAKNTFDDIKRRSPEGLQDFINDEKRFAKLALEKRVTRVADELSKIRRAIQQVAAAPEDRFSAQEKGERIEELREIERNLLKAVDVRGMREQAMM